MKNKILAALMSAGFLSAFFAIVTLIYYFPKFFLFAFTGLLLVYMVIIFYLHAHDYLNRNKK